MKKKSLDNSKVDTAEERIVETRLIEISHILSVVQIELNIALHCRNLEEHILLPIKTHKDSFWYLGTISSCSDPGTISSCSLLANVLFLDHFIFYVFLLLDTVPGQ